jgi:transcriptional regulator with XRE-family HTH domain
MKNEQFNYAALAHEMTSKRTKEGVSLRELSDLVRVPLSSLSRASNTASKLDIETIISICNWLGVEVQHFLTPEKSVKNGNSNKGKNSKKR